ncbi:MAG: LysM peptidoglycan-binding domain-containing protein, partial [Phycisphaerae bacterium]|nr:LysM peptidoglycan-binding domain-containing protein [Phycisphaerae bacterium]
MTGLGKIIFWISVGAVFGISAMLVLHYWPTRDEAEDPLGPEHISTPFGDEGQPPDEADEAEPVPAAPADGETAEEAPAQEERPEEPAAPPVVKDASVTTEKAKALLAKAAELEAAHKSVAARNAYGDALGAGLSAKDAASVKAKLAKLNEKILFAARLVTDDPDSKMYRIRSGDSLSVIAKRYFITVGLLKRINRMG